MTGATALERGLDATWSNEPGLVGQLKAVNHSTVGLRYIVTSLVFLLAGGMLAMFMRVQLAWSDQEVLDYATYNQFVTMHGTTMMFLFAVPLIEGIGLYLVPKMIGARDVPFPRLTAFGYWCYLLGGLFLFSSFLFGEAPDAGWFMYVPLTDATFTPGKSADFWLLGVTLAEIAALGAAIELVVAILKMRAPGMSIQRMPLFAWYMLATMFMIVLAFPPLILGSILLEIERAFGFVFYNPDLGGDPLLWQHLFWLFGHPDVYILFLPAAGIVSTLVPVFARRPIVGYTWVVLAVVSTAFISFGLWVHHMYAVGIPLLALSFFSAASMGVAIPAGVQVFAWIATLWTGRPLLRAPMRFILGFFVIFVLGGLTGVMVALVPFDWQVHDTHFVVAHLHYVLIGGLLFPALAGLYHWLPQVTGRMVDDGFARIAFWLIFIGFNLTFLPMHLTGLLGMPRRAYTYSAAFGEPVQWLNLVSTAAGFVLAFGFVAFLVSLGLAWRHGARAERNPWEASTLEWAMPMPPPAYNFVSQPTLAGREPLWDQPELTAHIAAGGGFLPGAPRGVRETLGTTVRGAVPEYVVVMSGSTWVPLVAALVLFAAIVSFMVGAYVVAALVFTGFIAVLWRWLWTTGDDGSVALVDAGEEGAQPLRLPTQGASAQAPGVWGVSILMLVTGALFVSLVFSYFYLWLGADAWPPAGTALTPLAWPLAAVAALLVGSGAMHAAWRRNGRDDGRGVRIALGVAVLAMTAFIAAQALTLAGFGVRPQVHAYASLTYALVGFHAIHAAAALLMGAFAWCRAGRGLVSAARPLDLQVTMLFWHFTGLMWLVAFVVLHAFPRVQ